MEPQLPMPQIGPEHSVPPQPTQGGEAFKASQSVEYGPAPLEQGSETREGLRDGPQGDPAGAPPVFTPPPLPVIEPVQADGSTQPLSVVHDAPATASDDDLIEREWVEKAKRLVSETRNDPHAQEDAISRLQADYLQKRYGKTVKTPQGDG